jgi:hypothetical protein
MNKTKAVYHQDITTPRKTVNDGYSGRKGILGLFVSRE